MYLTGICLFVTTFICPMAPGVGAPPRGPGLPQLSPQEVEMLQQVDREINAFVESLPPEAQKQFWQDVEELTEVMQNMEPQELDQFIQGVMQDEVTELPIKRFQGPQAEALPPVEKEKPHVSKIKKEIKRPTKKTIEAAELIDSIIYRIEQFILKTQAIPKFDAKIEKWVRIKKIDNWKPDQSWAAFKHELEQFVQKLYKLKDKDAETKGYIYLDDVISQEGLVNNLKQLNRSLKQYEPIVEAPSFGLTKISRKSRMGIQRTMSVLAEAINTMKMPQEFDAIFKKQEPKEAELKKAAEETEKQALARSRERRIPQRAQEARAPAERVAPGVPYSYEDYGYAERYIPPSYQPAPRYPRAAQPTAPSRAPTVKKPVSEKVETEKKKKEEETKKVAPAAPPKDATAKRALNSIGMEFDIIVNEINDPQTNLKNIEKYLYSNNPVNMKLATEALPRVVKALRSATSRIKGFKLRLSQLKKPQQAFYKAELKAEYQRVKKILEDEAKVISSIKTNERRVTNKDKAYAFLGKAAPKPAESAEGEEARAVGPTEDITKLIPYPTSIYELKSAIVDLQSTVRDLVR